MFCLRNCEKETDHRCGKNFYWITMWKAVTSNQILFFFNEKTCLSFPLQLISDYVTISKYLFQLRDILKVKLRTAQEYDHIKYNKYFSSNEFLNHTITNAHTRRITDQMTKHKNFLLNGFLTKPENFNIHFLYMQNAQLYPIWKASISFSEMLLMKACWRNTTISDLLIMS